MDPLHSDMRFKNAFEVHNPGPVPFTVIPLTKVIMDPITALEAADRGSIVMLPDLNCQVTIREVAIQVYQLESDTLIWHKNVSITFTFPISSHLPAPSPQPPSLLSPLVRCLFETHKMQSCGDKAGNSLLYIYICSAHKPATPETTPPRISKLLIAHEDNCEAIESHQCGRSSHQSMKCHFAGRAVKRCQLPDFWGQSLINLAYLDSLFYVTVAKIRELHDELVERLKHGLTTPETLLLRQDDNGSPPLPTLTVKGMLERLGSLWGHLTQPEVIVTLDTALRFRNLGHWSVVIAHDDNVVTGMKDCRKRRASLLKPKPGREEKNKKFLASAGLLNVFEASMTIPKICMLVKGLHLDAMRDKELFYKYITNRIDAARAHDLSHHRTLSQTQAALGVEESSDLEKTSSQGSGSFSYQTCSSCMRGPSSCRCIGPNERSSSQHESAGSYANGMEITEMVDGRQQEDTVTCQDANVLNDARRQQYALDLYKTNGERFPSFKDPRGSGNGYKSNRGSTDSTSLPTDPHQRQLSQSTQGQKSDGRSTLELSELPSQEYIGTPMTSPIESRFSTQEVRHNSDNSQVSRSGHSMIPLRENVSPMIPPPVEGTWSVTRDELWNMLPEVPKYGASPSTKKEDSGSGTRKASFSLFGLGKKRKT